MFKPVWLMRRKPGMSKADFIAYYETAHRLIGEKVLAGAATRYVRRFLHAFDEAEPVYDVLMEMWFPGAEAYQSWLAGISVAFRVQSDMTLNPRCLRYLSPSAA